MHALLEGRKSPQGVLTDAVSEPLSGLRVLVTRPAAHPDRLAPALMAAGATVDSIPTIRIADPPDPIPLRRAAAELRTYDWIVLTSPNGVERLAIAVSLSRSDLESARSGTFGSSKLAVIGPATSAAARALGIEAAVMPAVHRGEELAAALIEAVPNIAGMRILLARASNARDVLPERLRAAGALVDDVPAYSTHTEHANGEALRALILDSAVDWITFTAASTVTSFVELVGATCAGARVAAIGPITAAAVVAAGLPEPVVARHATAEGLVQAIVAAASS